MNRNQPQLNQMINDLELRISHIKTSRQDLMAQKQTTLKNIFQSPSNLHHQQITIDHHGSNDPNSTNTNINQQINLLNQTVQTQNQQITDLRRQLTNSNIEIQNLKDQMQQFQQNLSNRNDKQDHRKPKQHKPVQSKKSGLDPFQEMEDRFNQQFNQQFNQMRNMMEQQMRGGGGNFNTIQRQFNVQGGSDMMKDFYNDSFFNRSQVNPSNQQQSQHDNQQSNRWNSHQSQVHNNQQQDQNKQKEDDLHKTQILNQSTSNNNNDLHRTQILNQSNANVVEEPDEEELEDSHNKDNQHVSNIHKSKNQRKDFMNSLFTSKDTGSIITMSKIDHGLKVYKMIEECKRKKKKYLDPDFEANIDSISTDCGSQEYHSFRSCKWLRPQQIFKDGKAIKIFDNISVNDIKQGQLGVCYLLATLSSLAEYPRILKKLFNVQEYNKYGCYSVNIFIQGKKQEIIIDDLFPCLHDQPVFARPVGNELWVLILEKAWCKLYGEYTIAQGGFPNVSQEHLTGAPGLMYSDSNQPEYWQTEEKMAETLMGWDKHKFLMGAGTRGQGEIQNEQGMISGHAYTILGIYKWKSDYLVKLRNPWGHKEFRGKYDETNDYIWQNDQLKNLVDYHKKDDGIFFMTVPELQENMDIISCCKEKPDYDVHQVFNLDLKSNEYAYFTFELSSTQEINFRIHQRMKQMMNDDNYKCSPVVFNIYKVDDPKNVELISSGDHSRRWGNFSVNHIEDHYTDFKPGKYLIELTVCWDDQKYPLVLNYYSGKKIGLKQIESGSAIEQLKPLIYSFYEKHAASIATDAGEYLKLNTYYDNALVLMYFKNKNNSFQLCLNFIIDDEDHYFDTPNGPRTQMEAQLKNGEHLFALVRPRNYYARSSPQVRSQMRFI